MLGKHRHQADDQRQFAIVGAGKIEAHRALGRRDRLDHLGVVDAEIRPAVIAQQLPGKNHVVGRHRRAVGKTRRRIEREGHHAARGIGLHAIGEQAVERERLVIAARQQALDHVAADIGGRQSLDDEGIEAVEGTEHPLHQLAALGRRRIGIARMAEVRGPCRLAMHGDGVMRAGRPSGKTSEPAGGQQRAKHQRAPGCLPLHQRGSGSGRHERGSNAIRFRFCASYHRGGALRGPAFSAHSWLYCRSNIGYQAAQKCHALAAFRGERAGLVRRPFDWRAAASGARKKGQIAMDHRIASARPLGRALTASFAAAGLLAVAMVAATPALAQQPKPAKPAAQKTPAKPVSARAGRAGAATGRRGAAAAHVFAVDEGVRQGRGNQ